jgi:hypothetical protein
VKYFRVFHNFNYRCCWSGTGEIPVTSGDPT